MIVQELFNLSHDLDKVRKLIIVSAGWIQDKKFASYFSRSTMMKKLTRQLSTLLARPLKTTTIERSMTITQCYGARGWYRVQDTNSSFVEQPDTAMCSSRLAASMGRSTWRPSPLAGTNLKKWKDSQMSLLNRPYKSIKIYWLCAHLLLRGEHLLLEKR